MTSAVTAQGEQLFVKVSSVWTKIHELKSVPEIGETADKIDATTLESESKEYVKDIPDQGDLEFTFNCMPVGATNSNLNLLSNTLSRNQTYEWKWVSPRIGKQVVWSGEFAYRFGAGEVSTIKDLILTIIPRTKPIETDITSTWTVSYNANGGTGTMTDASSPYANGATVTTMANTFTAPSGKSFANWNTKADNSGTSYDVGDTFSIYEATTLYAIWSD